jgi:hypothetical protein
MLALLKKSVYEDTVDTDSDGVIYAKKFRGDWYTTSSYVASEIREAALLVLIMGNLLQQSRLIDLLLFFQNRSNDRLCGLEVKVPDYTSKGPGFDSRRYQIF